ncbi:homeobox protein CDX-1 isoform X2 [Penaeus vannamei]|uniref:homeobox protein CDX-1 isoform X2 n=1 Tax=Penaeus vannamei TaxID=6689 RepID=UPI000F660D4B|nr:homeobox protein CDX-1-like [Penaeus vannamei]
MVLVVGASDVAMFPAANRPPPHSVVAQQSPAGYFGYYPQQAPHHHHHHHPHQYPPPDLNCNLQPFMTGQFSDGLQGGAWHNTAMYMPPPHHTAAAPQCQQRSPHGYEDWGVPPLHHTGPTGAASPLPHPPTLSSSAGGLQHPPHTPSPCAPGATVQPGPGSPTFGHYPKLTPVGAPPDFGSDEGLGGGGAQSPNEGVLPPQGDGADAGSPPTAHAPPSRPQQLRSPYEWMKKPSYQAQPNSDGAFLDMDGMTMKGKTRTKDKYRVVYSDHQRLELEKEFHYSRYITIRRKSELASMLGLSERQVKIWFQNRRAKERKQMKKRDELLQKEKLENPQYHAPTVTPVPPMPPMHAHVSSAQHLPTSKPLMMDVKPVLGLD